MKIFLHQNHSYQAGPTGHGHARYLTGLAGLCLSCIAHAQTILPPVIVSADPQPKPTIEPVSMARKRVHLTPGGANIVDAQQYKDGRVSNLDDALQFSPGVFIASRFGAEEARLSIRGSGLQRTFHMRGIQLLQDGVPLNLADGSADFQAVEPLSAQYVEVYRGANALQYGATSLGGAVNFVSASGLTAAPLSARVEAGSFGYKRAQMSAAGHSESMDWFIAASGFFQSGYRKHARQETQRISGNLGWQLGNAAETRFFIATVKTDSELPGALTQAEMVSDARQADRGSVANDQHRDFELYRLSNKTTLRLGEHQHLELGAFYSYKSLFHPIFQVLQQDSGDAGLSARYVNHHILWGKKNQFVLGWNLIQGELDDERFRNVRGQRGARTGKATQYSKNYTLFAENQHYVAPEIALIAGVQAVYAQRRLDDHFLADGAQRVDRTYRQLSPKLGVRQQLTQQVQLYGNVSRSVEPPSFGELTAGAQVTPVSAQRATTLELGTRGASDHASVHVKWDISLYRAHVKNELLALNDANGNSLGTTNADSTIHQGIEAGVDAAIAAHWTLRGAYQFNDFRFDRHVDYRDNRLAGVPRQVATAELLYKRDSGLYLGPHIRIASATYVDHANSLAAAGYAVVGFKFGQRASKGISWFVDARNLGNKVYAATTGVIADARGVDSRQFYPGDGRSVFAGVELSY